ncbi:Uma2 family endonuclease [Anoxybacillus sp. EFIL]|uniref:Uma2 family endonuclease n=1 Tax=Anoxybacillus sp. EFIL TaxID=2508869 RepID=UPI00148D288F|nr:Uma2 family endonuclease [Anoxybacillus sp. EFIL]NNU95813.1 Uma2 family endonuclease [Anoxybacillus sp. EFIL]
MNPQSPKLYTYADYVQWDGRWELINGKAYNTSPSPTWEHQFTVMELSFAFRSHFQNKNCYVPIAPFDVCLSDSDDYTYAKHVVQPDISVICNRNNLTPNGCLGAPTLIVEVLSPSTALKDRNEKFKLYEQFNVQEYWIVDPLYKTVEVFGLEDGFFKKREAFGENDTITSFIFTNFSLEAKRLFFQ